MSKPKGQKNGNNKKKHSKLIAQKKNKVKNEKELRKERLKAIIDKAQEKLEQENYFLYNFKI